MTSLEGAHLVLLGKGSGARGYGAVEKAVSEKPKGRPRRLPPPTELRSGDATTGVTLQPTMSEPSRSALPQRDKPSRARQSRDQGEQPPSDQPLPSAGDQVMPTSPNGASIASIASPPHKKAAGDSTDNREMRLLVDGKKRFHK